MNFLLKFHQNIFNDNQKRLNIFESIFFSFGSLFIFLRYNFFPEGFYDSFKPIGIYKILSTPLPMNLLYFLKYAWLISSLIAAFHYKKKFFQKIAAITGIIFLGHNYNFGNVYHSFHLYIGALMILAFAPKSHDEDSPYVWKLFMMRYWVVFVMFLTGCQKLVYGGGLEWALSDTFYIRLTSIPYNPPMANWILDSPLWVSQIFGVFALFATELLSPLALINRKLSIIYFFIWCLFHVMVTLVFGNHIMFYCQIFVYLSFLPLEKMIPQKFTQAKLTTGG